jgi:uncharacterized protein
MKRFGLSMSMALLVSLLFATVSLAQQNAADAPASKADIERFLDTMHSRDLSKNIMSMVSRQMHQMAVEQAKKQPSLPPDFVARTDKAAEDMVKNFPTDELFDAMIPVYQRHLTKGDVDAFIGFYSSPTGQKFLREMPAMTSEAMQASMGLVQKMMAQTMQRVQNEVAQDQKKGDANSKKPAQPSSN